MHLRQAVLVCVAHLLEDGGGGLGRGRLAVHHVEEAELVLNDVGDRLRVRRGPGPTAPDGVVDSGKLIRHSIGNVCSRRRPRVGSCIEGEVVWSQGVAQNEDGGCGTIIAKGIKVDIPRMTPSLKVTAILS